MATRYNDISSSAKDKSLVGNEVTDSQKGSSAFISEGKPPVFLDCLTLKMKVNRSFEKLEYTFPRTRRHIPEDSHLQHRHPTDTPISHPVFTLFFTRDKKVSVFTGQVHVSYFTQCKDHTKCKS